MKIKQSIEFQQKVLDIICAKDNKKKCCNNEARKISSEQIEVASGPYYTIKNI